MQVKVWFFSRIHQNEFCVTGEFIQFVEKWDAIRIKDNDGHTLLYEISDPELLRIEFVR